MKASAQLKNEVISTKVEERIAFGHDGLDPTFYSVLRNRFERVEASCVVLSRKIHRPGRSVSEDAEDGEVIQTWRSHQGEVRHALRKL